MLTKIKLNPVQFLFTLDREILKYHFQLPKHWIYSRRFTINVTWYTFLKNQIKSLTLGSELCKDYSARSIQRFFLRNLSPWYAPLDRRKCKCRFLPASKNMWKLTISFHPTEKRKSKTWKNKESLGGARFGKRRLGFETPERKNLGMLWFFTHSKLFPFLLIKKAKRY